MTPIVKEIEKASVKLQPLDLSPNDYVSDFLEKLNAKDEVSKADSMVKSVVDDKKPDENKISKMNPISEVSDHKERATPVMVSIGLDACDLRPVSEYQNRPPNND